MPRFVREWHLSESSYFLAGLGGFFHRYGGNGFQTKWAGLWFGEKKYLEYFAARLGNEWLSESNSKRFEYDGVIANHVYETSLGMVTETLCFHPSRNELMVWYELPRALSLLLEIGIDIRLRHENNSSREHSWKQEGNSVLIQNELGQTNIQVFSGKLEKMEKPFLKTHWPGNEQETCSVNQLSIRGKTIGFVVSNQSRISIQNLPDALKFLQSNRNRFESFSRGLIESNDSKIVACLQWSRIGIELLRQKRGKETIFCAGYPWFTQAWGRDTFWSIFGLTDLGLIEEAQEQLELFAQQNRDGRIPNLLPGVFNSIDCTPLWILAFNYVAQVSGNRVWIKKMQPFLEKSLEFLCSRLHSTGLLVHDEKENETWMDTLNRPQSAIEVQALLIQALEASAKNWKFFSGKRFPLEKELQKSKQAFKTFFTDSIFPPDRITSIDQNNADPLQTANVALPLFFGLFDKKKSQLVLERLESPDFSCQSGLRCRARDQFAYDPNGYHAGRVWSLTTVWLAMAEFQQHRTENGFRVFQALQSDLERNALGCVSETFNPETGQCNGGLLQLWGQALLAHLIDSYILGIQIDCLNKKIVFRPQLPQKINSVSRTKKISGKKVVFTVKHNPQNNQTECFVKNVPIGFKVET